MAITEHPLPQDNTTACSMVFPKIAIFADYRRTDYYIPADIY